MNNYDLTAQEVDYSILLSASPYPIPQLLRINHHPEFYVYLENTFSFVCFRTLWKNISLYTIFWDLFPLPPLKTFTKIHLLQEFYSFSELM